MRNDIYKYEKNHHDIGNRLYYDIKGECKFNMVIGEIPNKISINMVNNIVENYLSGIYIYAKNKSANRTSSSASDTFIPSSYLTSNTYYMNGFLGGVASASSSGSNNIVGNYHIERVYGNSHYLQRTIAL